MKVGLVLPQAAEDGAGSWTEIAALARQLEAGGADSLWLSDHFVYRPGDGPEVGYHEPFALLGRRGLFSLSMQQGIAETLFQPPDLLAHGGLRAMDALTGAGEAASVNNRDEATE